MASALPSAVASVRSAQRLAQGYETGVALLALKQPDDAQGAFQLGEVVYLLEQLPEQRGGRGYATHASRGSR